LCTAQPIGRRCQVFEAANRALPAFAGNIALTGHDDDFHQSTDALGKSAPSLRLRQMARRFRSWSWMPEENLPAASRPQVSPTS